MNAQIEISNLSFAYDKQQVLENINLDILPKDFVGIVGPNGGGKTTLLKLMLGLISPQNGKISILGKNPLEARNKIGYVPQYSEIDKSFPISVFEVVGSGLCNKNSLFPWFKKENTKRIFEILDKMQILSLSKVPFGELSGGQKQRCLIARALVSAPLILFLDEPTASVDSKVESDFYSLLKELNKDMTIVLVSHDIAFISTFVNKIACVNKNLVCHHSHEITGETLLHDLYKTNISSIHHNCGL